MLRSALKKLLSPKPCAPVRSAPAGALRVEALEDRSVPATFTVGNGYATIQAALNAAAARTGADTVVVPAGTYTESVVINDTFGVTLRASGNAIIKAPTTVTAPSDLAALGGAVIDVYSKNVTITGLTVNAAGSDVSAGIRVIKGGDATIRNNTVTGVKAPADPAFGVGIQVGSRRVGAAGAGNAVLEKNTITDYFAAGVLVDGASASATVTGNTIIGRRGLNGGVTQYGVQMSFGAFGSVEDNRISGNDTGNAGQGSVSAGVFLYQVGAKDVLVDANRVFGNEDGILVQSSAGGPSSIVLSGNKVYANTGFAGITVIDSSDVSVLDNDVYSNDTSNGIALLESSQITVDGNTVYDNALADGIYVQGGSGNAISNNVSRNNGYNGIFLDGSSGNTVTNNTTRTNGGNGVKVFGGGSNILTSGTSNSNAFDGILLEETVGNTVSNYTLKNNDGYGLHLLSATGTVTSNNTFGGNDRGSVG
ncbi:right-handed parallel beta-helix repeat-containing protein [Gemmata sp. JC717]|uniref:Right-handed parallel beta-helix repeat-containing protein n=1 Tax=Gemmata algarum TaxID=2975278 RepID=A0ABU5ESY2_9BACT|nr:right-handed parallel beta-helix repeat-containing protein [Gemmata algarum]MDY3552154.1 right-handed parallel beta-helix repeat-containing protein [Gemmata algarum]MDY3558310.1 right-handed parallel beta-helix repeat-containing protein [Gemmata algarum]